MHETKLEIKPWGEKDLDLLFQLNEPKMMEHLGGPESKEQILKRHQRYLQIGDKGCMFSIILPEADAVGSVGYWQTVWNDENVYEIGWSVLPSFQGKGLASNAMKAVIAKIKDERKYRSIHAFPSVHNAASNAICRKLGFTLISESEFEYPPGSFMQCNDWCLELE
ncbi:GNAT family N-acetyltransferase [Peribacillus muralis]|uniref:GNAT family N-acetyltransferase n=1 Tax=Peribacillus muralis TaxID=264697 RepID=UPI001F4F0431|nr:GNAT family N-acetyltransferase [Peribacillus muralis]MCK1992124.1 GNAT family N-acetyltransferase [Peribacillus muralis]MCK2012680.1 GNAT family N-acetyltransferase [Peribacillus muralis]